MIKKIFLYTQFTFILVFISGCTSAAFVTKKNELYAQQLQYTKVNKIIVDDKIKAIFNATYLNAANSDKWDNGKQNFLVTFYQTGTRYNYKITLNDKDPISKKDITKDDKLYTNITLRNSWSKYKIISFANTDDLVLNLKVNCDILGSISVGFNRK
jgi:hypothetical protein